MRGADLQTVFCGQEEHLPRRKKRNDVFSLKYKKKHMIKKTLGLSGEDHSISTN